MTDKADLVIRGGTIVDGTGGEPFIGDVAVKDGAIIVVGDYAGTGREEIDATGKIITPGFIDVHTHYDGQLTWSEHCSPSSSHGVTTVVTGNCGVGFAPCKPQDHDALINLLEGVEDMPEVVLKEGLAWNWETFPEYLDVLRHGKNDIDFAVQLPHSALRLYVMGDRAVDFEMATREDLVQMRALTREAIEAGAVGFGTSRNINHTNADGVVIPTAHSGEDEIQAIAEGIRDAGGGVIQAIFKVQDSKPDLEMFRRVSLKTGIPFSFTLVQAGFGEESWSDLLALTEAANQNGEQVTAQIYPRPVGVLLGLELTMHPFSGHPSYQAIAHLPLAERVVEMRKPETRARILSEDPVDLVILGDLFPVMTRKFQAIYPLGKDANYEPSPDQSIEALAAAKGVTPEEVAYDLLLEDYGNAVLLSAVANYEDKSLDPVRTMITHPNTIPALGDGGAHYGMICDSTYTTFMLTHWGRDRERDRIPLPQLIHLMTQRPAEMMSMADRGRIAVGLKADLNVIDYEQLTLHRPHVEHDLPSNGRRITQDADGYIATIVSGEVIMRNGEPTGALPGRLVEGRQLGSIAAE